VICHHYHCVFVHVPKTAGQSVEHVFLNLVGLTWETRAPLLLRYNDCPELGPPRLAHLKAWEYVEYKYLPQEMFDAYFKFSFVRNPWSRVISLYRYLNQDPGLSFKEFVLTVLKKQLWRKMYPFVGPQSEFVCDRDGRMLVDFVGRFESLQADFNTVCERIKLPAISLPHVNKAKVSAGNEYQDYYDSESKECVAELYRKDIESFGYRFEG
jgi:hypothetical protein